MANMKVSPYHFQNALYARFRVQNQTRSPWSHHTIHTESFYLSTRIPLWFLVRAISSNGGNASFRRDTVNICLLPRVSSGTDVSPRWSVSAANDSKNMYRRKFGHSDSGCSEQVFELNCRSSELERKSRVMN